MGKDCGDQDTWELDLLPSGERGMRETGPTAR